MSSDSSSDNGSSERDSSGSSERVVVRVRPDTTAAAPNDPAGPPAVADLHHWLRRASRKFRTGVTVLKVGSNGRCARRKLFIGNKPEYFELTAATIFDVAYHLSDVINAAAGCASKQFEQFKSVAAKAEKDALPTECCLVVETQSAEISLIFRTISDRRDAQFLLRVHGRALRQRLDEIQTSWHRMFEATGAEALAHTGPVPWGAEDGKGKKKASKAKSSA